MTELPDREQRLLALLLAKEPDASPFAHEFSGGVANVDWARFAALVKRHRVGALVYAGLRKSAHLGFPGDLSEKCAQATISNAQNHMRAVQIASHLTIALKEAGIASAVIKGIGIAANYYDQPSEREMIDIDLLVEAHRFEDAQLIVEANGFALSCPRFAMGQKTRQSYKLLNNAFSFQRQEDGAQVDLHWRFVQNPVLLTDMDHNWAAFVTDDRSTGRPLPMLRAAPHFLYVMVHGMKSGWVRLKWLADVDRIARSLSGQQAKDTAQLAKQYGIERIVAASLCLANQILGTPCPAALQEIVERHDVSRLVAMERMMIFGPLPPNRPRIADWRHFFGRIYHSLSMHNGPNFKRNTLLRELSGPLDLEFLPLSPRWLWLMPVVSPLMGIWRGLKAK